MRQVKEEISEKQYKEYSEMDKKEFRAMIEATIPNDWRWGYGYYGCDLIREKDKYYISYTLGSTCD